MVTPRKYKNFGNEISVDVAYIQAAYLLDLAAHRALEDDNVKAIANVAAGWMELASRLHAWAQMVQEEEEGGESVELTSDPPYQMGFSPNPRDDDDEYEDDEDE